MKISSDFNDRQRTSKTEVAKWLEDAKKQKPKDEKEKPKTDKPKDK